MDFGDPEVRRVFFDLHQGLPRQGPGNRACTARALAMAGPLPMAARVLDIACGPGMQTVDLAELLPQATITALDNHAPFLAEAAQRAAARGVAGRVATVLGDMAMLPFPPGSFDLLWCEGAAYIIGLARALGSWRPLLAPNGRIALSEPVWLRVDPPAAVRRCFAEYPAMGDAAACRRVVRDCGYRVLGDFMLPEAAWWEHYYTPLEERLKRLAPRWAGDPVAQEVLRESREEIGMYRAYSAYYGYIFLVMAEQER
jgi:SAM-dependent methyltransferase